MACKSQIASPTPTKPNCLNYKYTSAKTIGCTRGSKKNLNIPSYKTCGNTNPYYKCWGYYYSVSEGRYINACQLENYYADFIRKGISIMYNQNVYGYYMQISQYLIAAYQSLRDVMQIRYSNLSPQCSALIIIKRVLAALFCEEEAGRILHMMKMDSICLDQEEYSV